ncbi:GntP family permease [Psittacicella gerlachiana]|uniref:Permease n=1 Tax=Psittacicella gerlachiana TaxID=2028574 RepID=A0A3A1YG76_9GAMM|nr:GntP family permease [Psittacicella gerlachiana]RIY36198.1 permease [Psittacicella gerlachiana]
MLIAIMVMAILVLLFLIIKLRVHPFVALTIVSLFTALAAGITVDKIIPTMLSGFGSTLASVALLVGLGAMIGRLLEVSGGARVLSDTLVDKFGEKRAGFAIGIASLLFGFPIFFDAGVVVMLPIIFSLAKRLGGSVLYYVFPSVGAFAVMHAFLPPHPGPVVSADLLGANVGLLVLVGTVCALPTWYFASYLYSLWIGKRVYVALPKAFVNAVVGQEQENTTPPSFARVIFILVLPIFLIMLETISNTLLVTKVIEDSTFVETLRLIGKTPIALLITLICALILLKQDRTLNELEQICEKALGPICSVIIVTGAGGMFGGVLRASGIGQELSAMFAHTGMPIIVAAFIIATVIRVAQGSATVALTTAAALVAPMVQATTGLSELDLCFIVIAIASGATVLSHVNDSGFWLMSRFLEMDTKTTLKTWTVLETLIGVVGFIIAFIGYLIF